MNRLIIAMWSLRKIFTNSTFVFITDYPPLEIADVADSTVVNERVHVERAWEETKIFYLPLMPTGKNIKITFPKGIKQNDNFDVFF